MYCQLAFSADAFERLIKYRIADSFRPIETPLDFPVNTKSWLDGFIATHIDFNRVEGDRQVIVNEVISTDGSISPNSAGYSFAAGAISMEVAANLFTARIEDVAAAGLNQPPAHLESIPVGVIHILVRASVDTNGIPRLQMELDRSRLAFLPDAIVRSIARAVSADFPLDIINALQSIFPPGNSRVLNAGITKDSSGSIVMRFEFPGTIWQSAMDHANDWGNFFAPGFRSNLGNEDWSMDLDGGAVAAWMGLQVNPSLQGTNPASFDAALKTGFIGDDTPRIVLTKHGRLVNACAGNDIAFDMFVNLDLSIPRDNLLSGRLSFDLSKDSWDVAKCFGVTILNPFSIFITAVDNHSAALGIVGLAGIFIFPIRAFAVLAATGALILGLDKKYADSVVTDHLKDQPKITQLPDGAFVFDMPFDLTNAFTNDWIVLKHCKGAGGRLLLTGLLNVPDAVLPRLTANDLEGFSKWLLEDHCDPGKGQVSGGSLALSLTPGYGADRASVQPVRRPTIPLKWGIRDSDGGDLVFKVLNDRLGIYQDPGSDYQEVYVPGIPGLVEVTLKASTVRKHNFSNFEIFPYPLRLRFFTNGGVREYEFVAPPELQDFAETETQAILRINNCKHRGTSLILEKYLASIWRGDPPQGEGVIAQKWDMHVRGLAPGRKATVWNQQTGETLVHAFADRTGRIDVSLVLQNKILVRSLLMGLDDEPFIGEDQLLRLSLETRWIPQRSPVEVAFRQTRLTEIDRLEFPGQIQTLQLVDEGGYDTLIAGMSGGDQFRRSIPWPYVPRLATPILPAETYDSREDPRRKGLVAWRGKVRVFTLLSYGAERTDILAEYAARSSYDLSAGRTELFVQASGDGSRVILFQKNVPVQFGTQQWEDKRDHKY